MISPPPVMYADKDEERLFRETYENARRLFFPSPEIDDLLKLYCIKERDALRITRFLAQRPPVSRSLVEAYPVIQSVFGRVEASLEIEADPEGDFEELFCVITSEAEPEQALALLWRFDDLWYDMAPTEANDLSFTVDTADHEV